MAKNKETTNKHGDGHTGEYKELFKEYSEKYPDNAGRLKELLEQIELLKAELTAKKATDEEIDYAIFDLMINRININPELRKDLPHAPPDVAQHFSAGVLFIYAQAYYKILEVVSSAPVCYADLLLNQYYLQIVKKIKYLLSLDELKGFTGEFNPPEHILPSCGLGDIGWEDGIAPQTENFLVSVQTFLNELDFKGDESEGLVFVRNWLRKKIEPIIEKTEEYRKTTERYFNGLTKNLKNERDEIVKTSNNKEKKPQVDLASTKQNDLTDTESNILEALGDSTLHGPELLKKAGYDNSSHYRAILSGLVKRNILDRNARGYHRK